MGQFVWRPPCISEFLCAGCGLREGPCTRNGRSFHLHQKNKYDLVHFSTHSISSNQYGDGKTGVLLNKDNINDGFLSESEISDLKLNGQIIYLSSCNSGLGEYIVGEGLLSISRAFLSAGAAGVISSLWPVDDKAAKETSSAYAKQADATNQVADDTSPQIDKEL